jgi:hypothetical protein
LQGRSSAGAGAVQCSGSWHATWIEAEQLKHPCRFDGRGEKRRSSRGFAPRAAGNWRCVGVRRRMCVCSGRAVSAAGRGSVDGVFVVVLSSALCCSSCTLSTQAKMRHLASKQIRRFHVSDINTNATSTSTPSSSAMQSPSRRATALEQTGCIHWVTRTCHHLKRVSTTPAMPSLTPELSPTKPSLPCKIMLQP